MIKPNIDRLGTGGSGGARMVRPGRFILCLAVVLGVFALGPPVARASLRGQEAPELANEVWINSEPLRLADLRGRVILLEFWTYG